MPANKVCPPGTDAQTVCVGGGDGKAGIGGGSPGNVPPSDPSDPNTPVSKEACWTECVPHGCGGVEPAKPKAD